MGLIQSAGEVNALAAKEDSTGGVYFVTAFSGLLAPYWDPGAAGLLIGRCYLSRYNIFKAERMGKGCLPIQIRRISRERPLKLTLSKLAALSKP